jgi:Xaa-Pro aminopeptidase
MTTLTAAGCRERRRRLWAALPDRPDWLLIADPAHLVYLAGYWPSPFEFRSTDGGALLILGADESSTLVADNLLEPYARAAHVDRVVAPVWYECRASAGVRRDLLVQTVLDELCRCPGTHFGVEAGHVPAGIVEGLRASRGEIRFTDVAATLRDLRRRKDADEMELVRRSITAGDAAHAAALSHARPGMTELDVYRLVADAAQQAAGEQALVYGDFASGPRCIDKGGPATDRVIRRGDCVLLDFSVVIRGYRGDFANTFVCGAPASAEQKRQHAACLAALAAAESIVRPGVAARDIDRAIRDSFAAAGLEEYFTSHSGHGLGLGHPDLPYLVPESNDTLLAGDVIAIEPGVYVPGVSGMRFERNYLVTETGPERLSHLDLSIEQPAECRL